MNNQIDELNSKPQKSNYFMNKLKHFLLQLVFYQSSYLYYL